MRAKTSIADFPSELVNLIHSRTHVPCETYTCEYSEDLLEHFYGSIAPNTLEAILSGAEQIPPLAAGCQISMAIPFRAPTDFYFLLRTIEMLAAQNVAAEYEIILLANWSLDTEPPNIFEQIQVIRDFISAQYYNVHVASIGLDGDTVTLGRLRNIVTGIIAKRFFESGRAKKSQYFVLSADSDICHVGPSFLNLLYEPLESGYLFFDK